jgi:hypothetical protein
MESVQTKASGNAFNKEMKMRGLSFKRAGLFLAITAALAFLAGCFESETTSPSSNTSGSAVLGVRVGIPSQSALSKGSVISLNKLILVLTSSSSDTIRDTITSLTIPALSSSVLANQTVGKYYALKPLRSWKLVATTKDARDSIIHRDSVTVASVIRAGDTTLIALSMNAKFVMYQANFILPDSIGSSDTSVHAKQKINFDRLVLQVDGVNVADSTRTYFPIAPTLSTLTYDYVPVGLHTVKMLAYGNLGTGPSQLLYKDSTVVNPGTDTTATRTLVYVGPNGNTATGHASVTIGKVNTIIFNGTPDANPFP